MNDNDVYVNGIVAAHTPVITYDVWQRINDLKPHIHAWANGHLYQLKLVGSVAKGTAITGTTDIDIFISLNPSVGTSNTLENVYKTLKSRFDLSGHSPREQNVSVGINHTGLKIDVVAGVQQQILGTDHSIWKRKAKTSTKTNVDTHVIYVSGSGRTADIKAVKIWRKLRGLDFPSFYLELIVIEALKGTSLFGHSSSANFVTVMNYLNDEFMDKTITDPANTANTVSEELTQAEKQLIKSAAFQTLQGNWNQAIWELFL